MEKFQVHPPPDEVQLQQRSAPGGSGYAHLHRIGAELGMAVDGGPVIATVFQITNPVPGFNHQAIARQQAIQMDAAFDFGLDDVVIDGVAEMRMRRKQVRNSSGRPGFE
jgi:hypothetical protein